LFVRLLRASTAPVCAFIYSASLTTKTGTIVADYSPASDAAQAEHVGLGLKTVW